MQELSENKMGVKPILPLIITMSGPAIFSMMVQALYNIVDSYFVSKISQDALTAISLVFPIQILLIAVAVGTGVGLNSLISRRLGEKRQDEADKAATHGLVLGLFNWVLFLVIGIFFSKPFLLLYTDNGGIAEMGTQYMQIICIMSFSVLVEINVEKTLQATGSMIFPMIFQLVGAMTNILLDPVLIFGMFGLPEMGVVGAAAATVFAQFVALSVALTVLFTREHDVTCRIRGFRLDWRIIRNIYSVGLPAIIMQAIGSVMVVGVNAILTGFTLTAVTVFGVYFKLQSFIFMPVFGLMQGIMPIMGYNFGARKIRRLLTTVKYGAAIALCMMAAGLALFWILPAELLKIFSATDTMLEIGVPALRTISLSFLPAALGIAFSTTFQAVGKGVYSLVISLLRQLIALLPLAFALSFVGLSAVWYSFPLAEIISLFTSIGIFVHLYRTLLKPFLKERKESAPLPSAEA